MKKLSLEDVFSSYFHNKYTFQDFCSLEVESEYKNIFHSKNTYSPSNKLKQYQKFLNLFIFDYLEVNEEVVYSYRKGVSAIDAVSPHKNSKYIYSTDIRSFFTSIDIKKIRQIILKNKDNYLIDPSDIETYIKVILNLVTYHDILPVGAPTSPKISNAYLYDFDNSLQSFCESKSIIYSRYSDDLILSAQSIELFSVMDENINKIFAENGLEQLVLNNKKTKLQKQGSRVSLLGLVITPNGYITVDKKIKDDIETLLHFYLKDKGKFEDFFEKNYASSFEKVSGILSHINSIDRKYITKLRKKYGSYLVNSFIHRDISDA